MILATVSFAISFTDLGLIGALAPIFTDLYQLSASQTALLVAVPVLLGSLARLPMGMLTDRFGGRVMFTLLLDVSAVAAFVVPITTSYESLVAAAFFIGLAGSSFAIGAAFVSRWTPPAMQGTALGTSVWACWANRPRSSAARSRRASSDGKGCFAASARRCWRGRSSRPARAQQARRGAAGSSAR